MQVTPRVGVWIETPTYADNVISVASHSPRGSVD